MVDRPPLSIIVTMYGTAEHARALAERLRAMPLAPGDELLLADNGTWHSVAAALLDEDWLRVVPAPAERSPAYARNRAAERAGGEWLVFLDTDCRPAAGWPDAFFDPPPAASCGALIGAVEPADGRAVVAAWAHERGWLDPRRGGPITGNLAVRRAAWEQLGGFAEGIREGGGEDLCERLARHDWTLEQRPHAVVVCDPPRSAVWLLRQCARHGTGRTWLARRGLANPVDAMGLLAAPAPGAALAAATRRIAAALTTRDGRRALAGALDAAAALAELAGRASANAPLATYVEPPAPRRDRRLLALADEFPSPDDAGFSEELRALRRDGWSVRVEALRRPHGPQERAARRELRPTYLEDDGALRRLADLAWLWVTRPRRALRERRGHLPLRALAPAVRRAARRDERRIRPLGPVAERERARLERLLGTRTGVPARRRR